MRIEIAIHALALVAAMAVSVPVGAQTIEQRAAEVRQSLASPPPIETVIDRGTRVLGAPAAPAAPPSAAGAATVDPRSFGTSPAPAPAATAGPNLPPMTGGNGTLAPRGSVFVNDPRGTGFLNDTRGAGFLNDTRGTAIIGSPQIPGGIGVRGAVPGLTVIRVPGDGQVSGTSNLVTGDGRAP
jgi:hypothetical protein